VAGAAAIEEAGLDAVRAEASQPFILGPPKQVGPVVVQARFELHDINAIDDNAETFEFVGVLELQWRDPRQAFDPAEAGVEEKVFQGNYQFNEVATGWYPQVVLVNESGLNQNSGVVLRVRPDGTSTLLQTINASAEVDLDMRLFPFDSHRLEAVFEVLGFDNSEILLQVDTDARRLASDTIRVPQWRVTSVEMLAHDRSQSYVGQRATSSTFILIADVQRNSSYARRLLVFPLVLIVLLSFSVFWMDRSSLGDRLSVSFIGVLTAVTYQFVTNDQLPHISYITLIHAFLMISFLMVCATVVVNLVVGTMDKRGETARGDRVDYYCRWIFPLLYFSLILTMLCVEYLLL
jgi:hypothetical protein